jgi:hypothetical protein
VALATMMEKAGAAASRLDEATALLAPIDRAASTILQSFGRKHCPVGLRVTAFH